MERIIRKKNENAERKTRKWEKIVLIYMKKNHKQMNRNSHSYLKETDFKSFPFRQGNNVTKMHTDTNCENICEKEKKYYGERARND